MGIRDWFKRKSAQAYVSPTEESVPAAKTPETEDTEFTAAKDNDQPEQQDVDSDAIVIEEEAPDAFEIDDIIAADPDPTLSDLDFSEFWHDTKESLRRHMCAAPDYKMIRDVEECLGYKLPASYIELMKKHNGGLLNRCWFPLVPNAKQYSDFVQISGFFGIGSEAPYSLCGKFGSHFLIEGLRNAESITGIAISNVISPARGLILLDYETCGINGEPEIAYVNSESGEKTAIARNFEAFVRGLRASGGNY